MSDRRKAQRFAFSSPADAHLHFAQDVTIERSDAQHLTVLSTVASAAGEELALRLRGPDGGVISVSVRTLASQLVVLDGGSLRYRLDLQVVDPVVQAELT